MTITVMDILESLQLAALTLIVYALVRVCIFAVNKRKFDLKTELVYAALAVYVVGAASRVLLPYYRFNIPSELLLTVREPKRVNFIPFKTIFLYTFGVDSRLAEEWGNFKFNFWAGHIILSVPMGIFMQLLSEAKNTKISFKKAVIIPSAIFAAVEIIQFLIGRVADIDDIIINTLFCILGYILYNLYEKHRERKPALSSQAV